MDIAVAGPHLKASLEEILLQISLLELFLSSYSDSGPPPLSDCYPEVNPSSLSQHHGNLLHCRAGKRVYKPDENHNLLEPNHRMAVP